MSAAALEKHNVPLSPERASLPRGAVQSPGAQEPTLLSLASVLGWVIRILRVVLGCSGHRAPPLAGAGSDRSGVTTSTSTPSECFTPNAEASAGAALQGAKRREGSARRCREDGRPLPTPRLCPAFPGTHPLLPAGVEGTCWPAALPWESLAYLERGANPSLHRLQGTLPRVTPRLWQASP